MDLTTLKTNISTQTTPTNLIFECKREDSPFQSSYSPHIWQLHVPAEMMAFRRGVSAITILIILVAIALSTLIVNWMLRTKLWRTPQGIVHLVYLAASLIVTVIIVPIHIKTLLEGGWEIGGFTDCSRHDSCMGIGALTTGLMSLQVYLAIPVALFNPGLLDIERNVREKFWICLYAYTGAAIFVLPVHLVVNSIMYGFFGSFDPQTGLCLVTLPCLLGICTLTFFVAVVIIFVGTCVYMHHVKENCTNSQSIGVNFESRMMEIKRRETGKQIIVLSTIFGIFFLLILIALLLSLVEHAVFTIFALFLFYVHSMVAIPLFILLSTREYRSCACILLGSLSRKYHTSSSERAIKLTQVTSNSPNLSSIN